MYESLETQRNIIEYDPVDLEIGYEIILANQSSFPNTDAFLTTVQNLMEKHFPTGLNSYNLHLQDLSLEEFHKITLEKLQEFTLRRLEEVGLARFPKIDLESSE